MLGKLLRSTKTERTDSRLEGRGKPDGLPRVVTHNSQWCFLPRKGEGEKEAGGHVTPGPSPTSLSASSAFIHRPVPERTQPVLHHGLHSSCAHGWWMCRVRKGNGRMVHVSGVVMGSRQKAWSRAFFREKLASAVLQLT